MTKTPLHWTHRTGCKRKLDEIVQAPSPRRTTRQYSRAQKSQEGPHVADGAQKIQTRRQCGKGIVVEDNTEDYVKGKAKVEQGGQPKKGPEPVTISFSLVLFLFF
jgi:hypothetical protein